MGSAVTIRPTRVFIALMDREPSTTHIFHITDVTNLPSILQAGGLRSDAAILSSGTQVTNIAYSHIKQRRLTQYRVPSAGNRFVGEFVPFYFCQRSPMLFTINNGNTGLPAGSQSTIIHLVSTVAAGIATGRPWAISDGNAGSGYAEFSSDLGMLDRLDWDAIKADYWQNRQHEKMAEFLVADFFEWGNVIGIGCHNELVQQAVQGIIKDAQHQPEVKVLPRWYY